MNGTVFGLLGFVAIVLALNVGVVLLRTPLVLGRKRALGTFSQDGSDVSAFSGRLCRATSNAMENGPFFLALLLFALLTHQTDITDATAPVLAGARLVQAGVHLFTNRPLAILCVRFPAWALQIGIAIHWLFAFATAGP